MKKEIITKRNIKLQYKFVDVVDEYCKKKVFFQVNLAITEAVI